MSAVAKASVTALDEVLVLEIGARIGVGACGSLLAQLGADVVLVEPAQSLSQWKWRSRSVVAAGKRSVRARGADDDVLRQLLERADVVLVSSDVSAPSEWSRSDCQVVCDLTAFGNSGPLRGRAYTDALIQALSGIADTTGDPSGPPTLVGLPILEFSAGIYAAVSVLAALRVRARSGLGQDIDIALYDCAISMLATFLPFPVSGKSVTRAGNKHSLASPWNAYRASDGWVLVCTATDSQWARLCEAIGRPELAREDGFSSNAQRVANAGRVDSEVERWTRERSVSECIERLGATGIACGPILTVPQLATHDNLLHRGMIAEVHDAASGAQLLLPGSPLKASITPGRTPSLIPVPDGDREELAAVKGSAPVSTGRLDPARNCDSAYAGLRVVEIGQYTTAPLVARQLAALGAEVVKLEPPGGEGSRKWPPLQGDQGYFFAFSNSDKRSVVLDLRTDGDKQRFRKLLQTADVLVENLKPGALARLGFDAKELSRINPRLVYCAISGFGLDSTYPGRPAFDTVVQAMCGFMDLTRTSGTPMKAGISAADIMGGELALLAIVAALGYRDRSGVGQAIDISMQDAAVWATQLAWGTSEAGSKALLVACTDGHLAIDGMDERLTDWLSANDLDPQRAHTAVTKDALAARAAADGFITAPVNSVNDLLNEPQLIARDLVLYSLADDGLRWPLLNSPLRLSRTPPRVRRPIGRLGEGNEEIFSELAGTR
ncbi:MAG: CoA transferase [Betaproteobacteria bacterium]|nr:CoA transferase [Betaproteobacteria bacterium]